MGLDLLIVAWIVFLGVTSVAYRIFKAAKKRISKDSSSDNSSDA